MSVCYVAFSGKIRIRGKVETEKGKNGRTNLVITEIPYTMIGANIAKFLSDVASLAENKVTQDIVDITNQSGKEGIRIVIELRRDADVENFKNLLYKKTRLEDTFGVNMLAIADGRPETMGLRQILKANIDFQFETNRRKYTTLLEKEKSRREIQEGLIKACNVIDLIIEILRGSKDRAQAKACMVEGKTEGIAFKSPESGIMAAQLQFTQAQADAILDMRLYKLIGLELEALIKEHEETVANIYRYEDILEDRGSMTQVIRKELMGFKKAYGTSRRTQIVQAKEAVYVEKPLEEVDIYFVMDRFGYAKTIDANTYQRNKETVDSEFKYVVQCKNTGKICIFTNTGQLHTVKMADLPLAKLRDKGVPLDNIGNFDSSKEEIVLVTSQSALNLYRLIFVTKYSMCKLVDGGEFDVAKKTVAATKLTEGDQVVCVCVYDGQQNIVFQTKEGYFLKFPVEQIPEKKKIAVGVRGMKLTKNDFVENVYFTRNLEAKSVQFREKEVELNKLRLASRDGRGSKQ